jgi:hypothetical protein
VRLVRLDLATGHVVYLRAPWIGSGTGITW